MISQLRQRVSLRNVFILLLLFAFCLYLPSLTHYVFADDEIYLAYSNKILRNGFWSDIPQLLVGRSNPWEHLPVRDFSYWLDFRLYGDEASGFHLSNLIWYAVCCGAIWWLVREIILYCYPNEGEHASVLALSATVVFAIHPAHVESVAWIASRKDLMAGTFGFLSLACIVRGVRCSGRAFFLVLAAGLFFLACFSKAVAIANALLMVVILLAGCSAVSANERTIRYGVALVVVTLAAFALAIHFSVARETGIGLTNAPGFPAILERASRIQAALIGILLFPYPLQFYYDVYAYASWHWWISGASVLLAGLALAIFLVQRKLWAIGVLLSIVPTTMYLQFSPFTTWSLASERFVFASVAGLALLLVDLFLRVRSYRFILTFMLVVSSAAAYPVWQRVQEWEYAYPMLLREYERQPTFHNAVRDQIVFVLLPHRRYAEAAILAEQVQRPYAVKALIALIAAERAYREFSDASVGGVRSDSPALRGSFCDSVAGMRQASREGYSAMANEKDVSYNNILRTLDKLESQRFADAKSVCISTKTSSAAAH